MRIQHNITAMNSYRNFSNNTSALNKNLEKLASGYKINRAGDDAAGLAISEKMRAQISGLEGATKNAKDGISLIQTAEGALTEVHSMLNRMVTLAEQSANGTYQDELDRDQLQKEIGNLRDEIDRVADSTNYNGLKLLNGDLDYAKETVTVADSAITDIAANDYAAKGASPAFSVANVENRPEARATQQVAEFTVDLSDITFNGFKANDTVTLKIGKNEITTKLVAADVTDRNALAKALAQSGRKLDDFNTNHNDYVVHDATGETVGKTTDEWRKAYNDAKTADAENDASTGEQAHSANHKYIEIDGHYYEMSATGTDAKIKFTQVDKMDENADDINPSFEVGISSAQASDTKKIGHNDNGGQDPQWRVTDTKSGLAIGTTHQARATVSIDFSQLKDADRLVAGEKTYTFKLGQNSTTDVTQDASTGLIDLSDIFKEDADQLDETKQKQAMARIVDAIAAGGNGTRDAGTKAASAIWTTGNAGVEDGVGTMTFQSLGSWKNDGNAVDATPNSGAYIGGKDTNPLVDHRTELKVQAQFYSEREEAAATTSFTLDVTKIKAGDTFTIDGKTFEFTDGADASDKANVAVDLSSLGVASGLLKSQQGEVGKIMKKVVEGATTNGVVTEPAIKLEDGTNKYSFKMEGDKVTLTSREDKNTTKFESRVSAEVKTPTTTTYGKGLVLQIGDTADEYNKMSVSVSDMHSNALGIGEIDISTQDGASEALDKIKNAVNMVSDTRGNLGAMQNRLEHTINNLGVMRENVQNAESLIRDTDVAEEMMAYTKNNILNQSAQAMLAQANQLPQGVLQLLG